MPVPLFQQAAKVVQSRDKLLGCNNKCKALTVASIFVVAINVFSRETNATELSIPVPTIKSIPTGKSPAHALLFQLPDDSRGVVARDHFVFVDTSASQVGVHRLQAFAVLQSLLRCLAETDRVRLFAIDVNAEPLMESLATARSPNVNAALTALKARIPLGATNLQSLFKAVAEARPDGTNYSIIYIGDGMSTADLLEVAELRAIVTTLKSQKCPFHSYGVGPVINLQVLGVLAHQTGGFVDFDNPSDVGDDNVEPLVTASECGAKLAQAVQRPVYYPTNMHMSGGSFPLLPLRSDRATIHLLRGDLPADTKVTIEAKNANECLEWNLSDCVNVTSSPFLDAMTDLVEKDQGLSNSLAGRKLLQVFEERFRNSIEEALQLGEMQLAQGHTDQAARIAREVKLVDPSNPLAHSIATASERLRALQVSREAKAEDGGLEALSKPDPNVSLTREQDQTTRVKTEKLRNQVSNAIEESKRGEPEYGMARLKQVDNSVRAAIDIAPEDRLQLLKRLEAEIIQLRNSADKRAQDRVQLAEQLALLESQKLLMEQQELDESKLDGLIERVRGLMLEGRHGNDDAYGDAQVVADVAINLRPGEKTAAAARFDAEAAHQLARAYRLRARRADQVLETLHQVEIAHIPFPDEPPVRYPPAEVWRALTERRQKWKNVDLRSTNPRELRIQEELKQISSADFPANPLKDAIDILKSTHGIEIQFDKAALDDEGISTEEEVSLELSGRAVSLADVCALGDRFSFTLQTVKIDVDRSMTQWYHPVFHLLSSHISHHF